MHEENWFDLVSYLFICEHCPRYSQFSSHPKHRPLICFLGICVLSFFVHHELFISPFGFMYYPAHLFFHHLSYPPLSFSIYTITHILLSVIHCFVSLLCISWCKFYVGLCIVHHFPLYIFASLILQNSPYSFSHHITILIFHLIRVSLADLIHCFTSSFFHQLGVPSSLLHLIRFLFVGSFAGFHFEFGIFERIIIV